MKNKCIIFAHKHNVWRNEKKTHYKLTWTCFSFLSFFILIMLNWIFFPFFPKTFGIIISNRKHKSKTDLHFRSGLSRFFWEIRFVKIRQFQIAPLQTCCLDENRMQIFLSFFFLIKLMINVYGFIIKWERKAISNADCRHNLHSKTSERQGEEEQKTRTLTHTRISFCFRYLIETYFRSIEFAQIGHAIHLKFITSEVWLDRLKEFSYLIRQCSTAWNWQDSNEMSMCRIQWFVKKIGSLLVSKSKLFKKEFGTLFCSFSKKTSSLTFTKEKRCRN